MRISLTASLLPLVVILFISCDSPPDSRTDTGFGDAAGASARVELRRQNADSLASELIERADSALKRIEPLSSREVALLRQYSGEDQLAYARRFGIEPISDRRAAGVLMSRASENVSRGSADVSPGPADVSRRSADVNRALEDGSVVWLRTNDLYIIDPRMGYAVPLLVPAAARVVDRIGLRFQQNLMAAGVPPYQFIVTNMLRTGVDQAYLRGVNTNAATGESTHEYGTTVDVYYGRFHYAPARDPLDAYRRLEFDEARFRQRLREAYRGFGLTHAERIKAVLGRTLLEMQEDGSLAALYERGQPVFHLTVAREVSAPASAPAPEAPAARRLYANVESQLADVDDDIEDLEEDGSDVPSRAAPILARLNAMRDSLWLELDRYDPASELDDARSRLLSRLANMEGEIERARLEFAETPQGAQSRLRSSLRRMDLALSLFEGEIEHASERFRGLYAERLSDLRLRHGSLEDMLQSLESAPAEAWTNARSEAAAALARLVFDMKIVSEEIEEAR